MEKVTAREINEVAIKLSQRVGLKVLAKGFAKIAVDAAVETKGIAFLDKDSILFKEIEYDRKTNAIAAVS